MQALQQFAEVADGLALEAELFASEEPVAGVWTARTNALVCPAAHRRRVGFHEASVRAAALGWPVLIRSTGGGAVPQGPGVLNLSIAATVGRDFTIKHGYRLITGAICRGLGDAGQELTRGATPGSFCDGAWNLSFAGRKLAGTAQRRRPLGDGRVRLLAHALILTHAEIGPGVAAVDAFNNTLGLEPVRAETHTTLETAFGLGTARLPALAASLHATAIRALAELIPPESNRIAA